MAKRSDTPSSSTSSSITCRRPPSAVSNERCRSRPSTTTRSPLDSDSVACSASGPHATQRRNSASPSTHAPDWRSKRRGVEATVNPARAAPLGRNRSSGASVRFPTIVNVVSFIAVSSQEVAQPRRSRSWSWVGPAGWRCRRPHLPAPGLGAPRAVEVSRVQGRTTVRPRSGAAGALDPGGTARTRSAGPTHCSAAHGGSDSRARPRGPERGPRSGAVIEARSPSSDGSARPVNAGVVAPVHRRHEPADRARQPLAHRRADEQHQRHQREHHRTGGRPRLRADEGTQDREKNQEADTGDHSPTCKQRNRRSRYRAPRRGRRSLRLGQAIGHGVERPAVRRC